MATLEAKGSRPYCRPLANHRPGTSQELRPGPLLRVAFLAAPPRCGRSHPQVARSLEPGLPQEKEPVEEEEALDRAREHAAKHHEAAKRPLSMALLLPQPRQPSLLGRRHLQHHALAGEPSVLGKRRAGRQRAHVAVSGQLHALSLGSWGSQLL